MISAEEIKALMAPRPYKLNYLSMIEEPLSKQQEAILTLQTLLNQVGKVLTTCDEAMEYMSEYDIPLCLPDDVKQALAAIQPYLTKEGGIDE